MRRRRPPRLATALYVGLHRYSLTICCDGRKAALQDPAARDIVLLHLRRTSTTNDIALFAYCMMPDHLHLIAEGTSEQANCIEFVRVFKQTTGFDWTQRTGERLWQESFYDRILRSDEQTRDAVRYVLKNPVRAKLVVSPDDYPHSGSLVCERAALMEWAFGITCETGDGETG